jgi:hypothetical protein
MQAAGSASTLQHCPCEATVVDGTANVIAAQRGHGRFGCNDSVRLAVDPHAGDRSQEHVIALLTAQG